eukprot:CAMPEP_0179104578 /NCGR_PEP_ID=MMETSP0796-20121207/48519_1 /TAXON_ID=73915 /ORGANISM="Pyrodinium bahamense, Strain pbaha01" /LENGTH=76 /DNA_ID=CAMNT_0020802527 /DNA_START=65 /DNA_END=295 /DNA_ORIENTATION=-
MTLETIQPYVRVHNRSECLKWDIVAEISGTIMHTRRLWLHFRELPMSPSGGYAMKGRRTPAPPVACRLKEVRGHAH